VLGVEAPKIVTTRPGREVAIKYRGLPSNAQVKMAFFKTGQATLELLEPMGQGSAWQEVLDRQGESVHHIAFKVVDLEKSIQAMKDLGMAEMQRGRYDSDNGTYVYFDSKGMLGVDLELLHSDPPAKTPSGGR
jgi:methylmalonyl-CoA/ethylmalonyl-CoA epimerase